MPNKNCHEISEEPNTLIVIECDGCGFQMGLDHTHLLSDSIAMPCPACSTPLEIQEIE